MPYSAIRPRLENAVVNLAPAAAKRTSHISAWVRPMPAHAPLIAATIGLRSSGDEVRMTLADQRGDVGVAVDRRPADGAAVTHVRTRAERPSTAGQDDRAHRRVGLGPVHAPIELRRQARHPRRSDARAC